MPEKKQKTEIQKVIDHLKKRYPERKITKESKVELIEIEIDDTTILITDSGKVLFAHNVEQGIRWGARSGLIRSENFPSR